jgi:hypothetical protein
MPHSTTKKMRIKRPDTRPNEKERRKLKRKLEEDKSIQDIRVTRKLKTERQERELPPTEDISKRLSTDEKVKYLSFRFCHDFFTSQSGSPGSS